jgi:hypothetical protein
MLKPQPQDHPMEALAEAVCKAAFLTDTMLHTPELCPKAMCGLAYYLCELEQSLVHVENTLNPEEA